MNIKNINEIFKTYTEEVVYICVPTTKEREGRLENLKASLREFAGYPYMLVTYENKGEGFIAPIHRILSGLRPESLVWCIGDDTVLIEKDTLRRLVVAYKETFPERDGVTNPDDGIQNGKIITMPLCTAAVMIEGTHRGYFLNYADNEFTDRMIQKGKYLYCGDIKVDHQHWVNGKAPKDETYQVALDRYDQDKELYEKRRQL